MSDPKESGQKESGIIWKLKMIFAIVLLDFWIFGPIRKSVAALARASARKKGPPLIAFRFDRPRSRARARRNGRGRGPQEGEAMKTKLFGWTIGAILGIGVIAVLAVSIWGAIKTRIEAAKAASGTAA